MNTFSHLFIGIRIKKPELMALNINAKIALTYAYNSYFAGIRFSLSPSLSINHIHQYFEEAERELENFICHLKERHPQHYPLLLLFETAIG